MPKLAPLKQWHCDTCGEVAGINDGWLEWLCDERGVHEFRIVHNRAHCHLHTAHAGRAEMHIHAFLGADGLQALLAFLDAGPLLAPDGPPQDGVADIRNYVDTVRRLHIPHYEEARRYFDRARQDLSDENEVSIFLPRRCRAIIERYEKM